VERLTRVADGVEYELTIDDPNVFAAPWKVNRSFRFTEAPQKRIFEFVCEENNRCMGGQCVASEAQK